MHIKWLQYHCIYNISRNAYNTANKHEQLEVIIKRVTYYIEHKSSFYIYRSQNFSLVSRAVCQKKQNMHTKKQIGYNNRSRNSDLCFM